MFNNYAHKLDNPEQQMMKLRPGEDATSISVFILPKPEVATLA